jgi:hypothetical protein
MLKVYGRSEGKKETILRGAYCVYQQTREKVMNKEYLEAKVDLCLNLAEEDLKQQEIARAIKNLQRANSALSRIFDIDEGDSNE